MVDELHVARVVEVVDPERPLDLVERRLRRRDGLELLVVEEVRARELRLVLALHRLAGERSAVELFHDAREVVVRLRGGLRLAGDDERRPRLVDQDRVDLVDDRERVPPLHGAVERDGHVVAQVVEPELGVRPVRDVGRVGLAPLRERHHVLDRADGDAEPVVDGPVPLRVALREVVVDGHEVHVLAGERVEVERQARDEGLPLARLHLGDVALVEHDPAHQLDVEQPLPRLALARLADGGERLEEDVLELLAVLEPLLELRGLREQVGVAQRLEVGLERGDVRRLLGEALDAPTLADAEHLLEAAEARRRHGGKGTGSPSAILSRARFRTVPSRFRHGRGRLSGHETGAGRDRASLVGLLGRRPRSARAGPHGHGAVAGHGARRRAPLRRLRGRRDA